MKPATLLLLPTACAAFSPLQACASTYHVAQRTASATSTKTAIGLLYSTISLSTEDDQCNQQTIGQEDSSKNSAALKRDIDRRPHEQRVEQPRKARRLNHSFQHLYRHPDPFWEDNDWNDEDCDLSNDLESVLQNSVMHGGGRHSSTSTELIDERTARSAIKYLHLHGGYSANEIDQLQQHFPPLLELDSIRHLRPKMRFLKGCLGGRYITTSDNDANSTNKSENCARQVLDPKLKSILPANFFGSRLERTIAPRHAFLVHVGLPSGKELWDDTHQQQYSKSRGNKGTLFEEFLVMHRKPKQFAALCNDWKKRYGSSTKSNKLITSDEIVAFDKLFQRGLLSAARNDTGYVFSDDDTSNSDRKDKNTENLLQTANVTSGQLIRYLVQHGANPYETDVRGASLFHWASGCGNLEGLQALVDCCNQLGYEHAEKRHEMNKNNNCFPVNPGVQAALLWKASRDHATPLHWAAAGAGPKEFGIGGHLPVCSYLLSLCHDTSTGRQIIPERKLINAQTLDGNSILMWAAWSQSLDVVKLLIRNRADAINVANRNGCTVAHWAASGGSLDVCKYLAELANVDFIVENYAGNSPLDHAVAYRRVDVVKWLKDDLGVDDSGGKAEALALDFVNWADMGLVSSSDEGERRKVYDLFRDWSKEMGSEDDTV